jgi:hypothetical protein
MQPKIIFIVPYRDRKEHKQFFTKYMEYIMEDYNKCDYEIFFSHQCDNKPFNRGAMKNIGFLAMKYKYPDHYKNITFVFHDVDTLPYQKNLLPYETTLGVIKHFYGYTYALGGIVSIKGDDFEKTNGFPNMWGWSMEDNVLQKRVLDNNLSINRSVFFPIGSKSILQFIDGIKKNISKTEIANVLNMNYPYGIRNIHSVDYVINDEFINIKNFKTESDPNHCKFEEHDLTKPGSQRIVLTHKERYGNSRSIKGRFSLGGLFNKRK